MKKLFLSIVFLNFFIHSLQAQLAVPELWGTRIHDEASVLSTETIQQLEQTLKVFEDSTSNQIALLIIPSLEGEALEEYSLRVAETWKLGTKEKDNGVLLLVVVNDRKVRIEVGEGLEGPLPDAVCSRIIRNEIAPAFRRQDYDAGILAAMDAIMLSIKGEYASEDAVGDSTSSLENMSLKERILIGLFVFGILSVFTFFALFTPGCAGWGLYAFLIPFYATFPLVVLGTTGGIGLLGAYAFLMPILKLILPKTAWGKKMAEKMKNNSGSKGGGWSSGGGWISSGGGGWSSGGGGGFSGGGGSFGGGGSSGSW